MINERIDNCQVICGDSRKALKSFEGTADLIVTSPPYADARKNHYDSIHPDDFVNWFLTFHEPIYNALKANGSFVLNIKDKVVNGVRHRFVWRTIEALANLGWHCIDDYIWQKTNPMPGYWPNRLRDGWEYCFHLSKSKEPFFNPSAVKTPIGNWVNTRLAKLGENDLKRHNSENHSGFGRNISKWVGKDMVSPSNVISALLVGRNKGHPAVFPLRLPMFFIKLLCPPNGLVIDPFAGSGTTGIAAKYLQRQCILIDNNEKYCAIAKQEIKNSQNIARPSKISNHNKKNRIEDLQFSFLKTLLTK
jgi:DNA modification methylase